MIMMPGTTSPQFRVAATILVEIIDDVLEEMSQNLDGFRGIDSMLACLELLRSESKLWSLVRESYGYDEAYADYVTKLRASTPNMRNARDPSTRMARKILANALDEKLIEWARDEGLKNIVFGIDPKVKANDVEKFLRWGAVELVALSTSLSDPQVHELYAENFRLMRLAGDTVPDRSGLGA
jgi:hypothetical protein